MPDRERLSMAQKDPGFFMVGVKMGGSTTSGSRNGRRIICRFVDTDKAGCAVTRRSTAILTEIGVVVDVVPFYKGASVPWDTAAPRVQRTMGASGREGGEGEVTPDCGALKPADFLTKRTDSVQLHPLITQARLSLSS